MKRTIIILSTLFCTQALAQTTDFVGIDKYQFRAPGGVFSSEGYGFNVNKSWGDYYIELGYANADATSIDSDYVRNGSSFRYYEDIMKTNLRQHSATAGVLFSLSEHSSLDLSFAHTVLDFSTKTRMFNQIVDDGEITDMVEHRQTVSDIDLFAVELVYHNEFDNEVRTELGIGAEYMNHEDTEFVWSAAVAIPMTEKLDAKLQYRNVDEDYQEISAGIIYNF